MEKVQMFLQGVVLPGMGTVLVGLACGLAAKYIERLKDARVRELLLALVKAAEQIYGPGTGDLKRDYVLQQARAQGLSGVTSAKLEAAVWELGKGA